MFEPFLYIDYAILGIFFAGLTIVLSHIGVLNLGQAVEAAQNAISTAEEARKFNPELRIFDKQIDGLTRFFHKAIDTVELWQ